VRGASCRRLRPAEGALSPDSARRGAPQLSPPPPLPPPPLLRPHVPPSSARLLPENRSLSRLRRSKQGRVTDHNLETGSLDRELLPCSLLVSCAQGRQCEESPAAAEAVAVGKAAARAALAKGAAAASRLRGQRRPVHPPVVAGVCPRWTVILDVPVPVPAAPDKDNVATAIQVDRTCCLL